MGRESDVRVLEAKAKDDSFNKLGFSLFQGEFSAGHMSLIRPGISKDGHGTKESSHCTFQTVQKVLQLADYTHP